MPPKQATKGQKQIERENKSTISFYGYIIAASYIPVLIFRVLLNFSELQYTDAVVVFLVISTVIFGLCMKAMTSMASSKLDLNMHQGMGEHLKDIILVTVACQALGTVSMMFWLLWLLIPAVALYKLWVNILAPWIFQEAAEPTEKQKKKMERKMVKRQ